MAHEPVSPADKVNASKPLYSLVVTAAEWEWIRTKAEESEDTPDELIKALDAGTQVQQSTRYVETRRYFP